MFKAGALYFSIVIAFFIAVISASLIMLAAHYRNAYLKEIRFDRLRHNLNSGVTVALASDLSDNNINNFDMYGDGLDSLTVERKQWGIYDLAIIRTFVNEDTLKKAMLIGIVPDSIALYLSDEDRPLSVSGTTKITGDVVLPKAGLKKSYVEGKPYANDQLFYNGRTSFSSRTLSPVNQVVLQTIQGKFEMYNNNIPLLDTKELHVSFLSNMQSFKLTGKAKLNNVNLKGNIILIADSAITIDANSKIDGIQIYAPFINVENGFKGNCQLFATDSIHIGNQVSLAYPSVAAVISKRKTDAIPQIFLGTGVSFEGVIFTYEEKRTALQTLISLGKETHVKGEVFSTGLLKLQKGVIVDGKVSCNRFIMRTPTTLYENFLIDVTFNRRARSRYYLSARLFDSKNEKNVLKWLN